MSALNNDRITQLYDGEIGNSALQKRARRRIHWLCAQVTKADAERVLDMGCSQGIAAVLLGREGRRVVGVDREQPAIEFAKAYLEREDEAVRERVSYELLDATDLPYADASFDAVLLGEVIEHVVDPRPLLSEARRMLRDGGILALTTPYGEFPFHDHKEPIYLEPLLSTISEIFGVEEVGLIEAYLTIVARPAAELPAPIDWRRALSVAEERLRLQDVNVAKQRATSRQLGARVTDLERERDEAVARAAMSQGALQAAAHADDRLAAELDHARGELQTMAETLSAAGAREQALRRQVEELVAGDAGPALLETRAELETARAELTAALGWVERLRSERDALSDQLAARVDGDIDAVIRAEREAAEPDAGDGASGGDAAGANGHALWLPAHETVVLERTPDAAGAVVALAAPPRPAVLDAPPDPTEVVEQREREAAQKPDDPAAWAALARALGRAARWPEAATAALRAGELAPGDAERAWAAVDALARCPGDPRFEAAAERLGPLDALEDRRVQRLAEVAVQAGAYELAIRVAEEVDRRKPGSPAAAFTLAAARWELRDDEGARAALAPLEGEEASDAQRHAAARFHLRAGDLDAARAILARTATPDPRVATDLGRRLRQDGRTEESLEVLDEILAGSPANKVALTARTRVLADIAVLEERWAPPGPRRRTRTVHGRVLHLLQRTAPHHLAGSTVRTHSIGRAQVAAGLDVHMVTQPHFPWNLGVRDGAQLDELDGVRYHRLWDPGYKASLPLDERLSRNLNAACELVERVRPAVLHPHSTYINALVALELGRRYGIPVVYEVRGFPEERLFTRRHTRVELDVNATARRLERQCWRRADHVTTLAQVMRRHIAASGVPEERVTVVPNGIDPDELRPATRDPALAAQIGLPDDVPVVGYISTFAPYDGIQYLIRAVAQLKRQGRRVHCLLVGDGSERGYLEAVTDEEDVRDQVTFTGMVAHDDVDRYYGLIDIFVVPRPDEAVTNLVTPLKPYEAMATQRAVIVSGTEALKEMVIDGETGLHFEPENVESLAAAVERLAADPQLRESVSTRGREWVSEHRNWHRNVALYKGIYEQLGAA